MKISRSLILTLLIVLSGLLLGAISGVAGDDATPPDNPTVFGSPTHTVGVWSKDTTIGVNWIGSSDNTDGPTGVAGYSFSWTKDTTAPPDQTTDTARIDFNKPTIAAGWKHSVGVLSNGTVGGTGNNDYGQTTGTASWTDITAVAAGESHTVGLKSNGTAVAVGLNAGPGQIDVGSWTDIVAIAAGYYHTIGLKSDGTAVAVGFGMYGQTSLSDWTDLVAVAGGFRHSVGLKSDGTVVTRGDNTFGSIDTSGWTNIVAIAAGQFHTVGLKSNGTVVAVGNNGNGQTDVASWTDIVAIAAGGDHTVGLKSDGGVVAVGDNTYGQTTGTATWTDIVEIGAGINHTIGLRSDTTPVAVGDNGDGQINTAGGHDIKQPTYKTAYKAATDGNWWFNLRTADRAGNWSPAVHYGPFKIDATGPAVSISAPSISTKVSKALSFKVWWPGVDSGSGVASYDIQYKINAGGAWTGWKTNTALTSAIFKGEAGKTYYFRARARDNVGNSGSWSTLKSTIVPYDNNSRIARRSGFAHLVSKTSSGFYLGTSRYSTQAGNRITYRFTGKSIALIGPKAKNRSKAKIYINGRYIKTIDARASSLRQRKILFSKAFSKGATRTITIENLGTSGRSRFDVDGLAVGR